MLAADTFVSTVFFFNDTATTEIYTRKDTLSLHDALPIFPKHDAPSSEPRLCCHETVRSEEHTSELQSPFLISYAVFCLKKKKRNLIYIIIVNLIIYITKMYIIHYL